MTTIEQGDELAREALVDQVASKIRSITGTEGFSYEDFCRAEAEVAVDTILKASTTEPNPEGMKVAEADPTQWQDMSTAPKDGTLVELVVDYSDGGAPLHDAKFAPTIGFNNLSNTDEDVWQFAGWSWEHDVFCQGSGKPVAWRPSRLNAYDEGLGPVSTLTDTPSHDQDDTASGEQA